MKTKLILFLLTTVFVFMWISPAIGQTRSSIILKAQYETVLDELIANCENKATMLHSDQENIRKEASIALMKASFYRKNRELLIEDMMENGVEEKFYKVAHFLNERFFAIVRQDDPGIAEAYSEPDEVVIPEKQNRVR